MDRRAFLKLGGAGLAGVALLGSLGSGVALAQGRPSPRSTLVAQFEEAAEAYGVSAEVLMAMGYVNTRWEMPPPEANDYEEGDPHGWGSYGIMALVRNPFSDTLGEASRLTGIPEGELKTSRAANIRGGAALLASSLGPEKPSEPAGFFAAVAGRGRARGRDYAAVAGVGSGELYAQEVFGALERGASRTTLSGEKVSLPAREPASPTPPEARGARKPRVVWHPAHRSNYTRAYRGAPQIDKIVIHVTQGSWSSAINWFRNPSADVSAHYVIRSRDGQIAQCVSDLNIAWHAGNWGANRISIGIEHEGFMNDPDWFTPEMYRSSARLAAYLCRRYRIPVDRAHIVGHNQVASTPCPGRWWWWDYYMERVRRFA